MDPSTVHRSDQAYESLLRNAGGVKVVQPVSFRYVATIISVVLYLADLGSDIYAAYIHHSDGNFGYFQLTLLFVLVPYAINTTFNFILYFLEPSSFEIAAQTPAGIQQPAHISVVLIAKQPVNRPDRKTQSLRFRSGAPPPPPVQEPLTPAVKWTIRILCSLFMLSPVSRDIEYFIYGLCWRTATSEAVRQLCQMEMIRHLHDGKSLRVFETFLEAAPQLGLQLYILAVTSRSIDAFWGIKIALGLIGIAESTSSFEIASREQEHQRLKSPNLEKLTLFIWRLCLISIRIFSLLALFLVYPWYFLILAAVHWLGGRIWLSFDPSAKWLFEDVGAFQHWHRSILRQVAAAIFFVADVDVIRDEKHQALALKVILNAVFFIENACCIALWVMDDATEVSDSTVIWVACAGSVLFLVGLGCLILYYKVFRRERVESDQTIQTLVNSVKRQQRTEL